MDVCLGLNPLTLWPSITGLPKKQYSTTVSYWEGQGSFRFALILFTQFTVDGETFFNKDFYKFCIIP